MSLRIKDIDRGYKRILKDVRKLKDQPYVKVGVLESSGLHRKSPTQSVASLASVHEYGSTDGRIPERSFIRSTMDANTSNLLALTAHLKDKILFDGVSVVHALGKIGLIIQGLIQKQITDGDFEPLQQATIDRKGSSKPLIDTGQLRASIRYEIVPQGD